MKKIALFGLALSFTMIACREEQPISNPAQAENFNELNVSQSFDWNTVGEYRLNLKAVVGAQPGSHMLTVLDQNGAVLHKAFVPMNANGQVDFVAPAGLDEVRVTYGIVDKKVAIANNTASFDFLPLLDNSDLN